MTRAVSSISNILSSIENLLWVNIAEPNNELLICKNDYISRLDELTSAGSAILWNVEHIKHTHHWSADLLCGVTTFQDFGNKKLYRLTDDIKYLLDETLYIPVYDYTADVPLENEVNKLVVSGPIDWIPIYQEPNEFKTSMFITHIKYTQSGYR